MSSKEGCANAAGEPQGAAASRSGACMWEVGSPRDASNQACMPLKRAVPTLLVSLKVPLPPGPEPTSGRWGLLEMQAIRHACPQKRAVPTLLVSLMVLLPREEADEGRHGSLMFSAGCK
eukprot:886955-Pelagomonas_calceolata.AAC.1